MSQKSAQFFGVVGAVLFLGSVLSACSSLPKAPTATPQNQETPQEETTITIANFEYSPKSVTVRPGATVRVTNKDGADHSITSDDGSSFDSGLISQGATGEFSAPLTSGTYTYHCSAHPSMKGTLVVE